jgi:hypothetical protein
MGMLWGEVAKVCEGAFAADNNPVAARADCHEFTVTVQALFRGKKLRQVDMLKVGYPANRFDRGLTTEGIGMGEHRDVGARQQPSQQNILATDFSQEFPNEPGKALVIEQRRLYDFDPRKICRDLALALPSEEDRGYRKVRQSPDRGKKISQIVAAPEPTARI